MLGALRQIRTTSGIGVRAFSDYVQVEHDEVNGLNTGVLWVRLNRPEKLNALTEDFGKEFKKTMETIGTMEDVRSVIITGNGKAFSAGGDIDFLLDRRNHSVEENTEVMMNFYNRFLTLRDVKVPVIAAINGPAVGAGMCLAMACDLRIASKTAKMAVNFVKLGIHPGMAATFTFSNVAGSQAANYMLMTGDMINGEKAKELGLVLESCDPEGVTTRALEIARSIASSSPIAVRAVTKTLRNQSEAPLRSATNIEAITQSETYHGSDMLEGLNSVKEKRKPKFTKE